MIYFVECTYSYHDSKYYHWFLDKMRALNFYKREVSLLSEHDVKFIEYQAGRK